MLHKVDKWHDQVRLTLEALIEDMVNDELSTVEIRTIMKKEMQNNLDYLEEIVLDLQEDKKKMSAFFSKGE